MSQNVPGRTVRAPNVIPVFLLALAVVLSGCTRVTSPVETTVPGTPAPAPDEAPVVAPTPVDTTPAEMPPAAPPVEPVPAEVPPAEAPPIETRALTDVQWRLTDLDGEPIVTGGIEGRDPHIRLSADGTMVSGATGCNTFSGPYTLTGDALSFGDLVSTKVACTDPGMADQEQRFLNALDAAERFEINGDVLTLYTGMQAIARFEMASGM
jgi:heat shock protein HslJ